MFTLGLCIIRYYKNHNAPEGTIIHMQHIKMEMQHMEMTALAVRCVPFKLAQQSEVLNYIYHKKI